MAYYIVCEDCCQAHKICSKCSKDCEELQYVLQPKLLFDLRFISSLFVSSRQGLVKAKQTEDAKKTNSKPSSSRCPRGKDVRIVSRSLLSEIASDWFGFI